MTWPRKTGRRFGVYPLPSRYREREREREREGGGAKTGFKTVQLVHTFCIKHPFQNNAATEQVN